jgi:predicted TIM-barrel fold metal-dependent hydrolase
MSGDTVTEPLTVVSLDSHAQVPPERWDTYLEAPYRHLLPRLRGEHEKWITVMGQLFVNRTHTQYDVFDQDGAYRAGGLQGMFDCTTRLAEMDREGIAGEFVYNGEPRATALFFQPSNSKYDDDACEAGVRAHHRWAHEEFGRASDRILLAGVTGHAPCRDMAATLAETRWLADHGFVGLVAPGMTSYADQLPLYDEHWDPLWSACEDLELTLIVHAGYGPTAGPFFGEIASVYDGIQEAGGLTDELLGRFTQNTMATKFFSGVGTRLPLWQLTLGGVFDRHPRLKLLLTEIRADWLPATLAHLDALFDRHRDDLPTRTRPSEHWQANGTTCLSFAHRAEIEMRHEIGVDCITFGRDYPHPEGTWPNTQAWIRDAFAGVPEDELRLMLGENAIRRLGLDAASLRRAGARVGPAIDELMGGPAAPTELLEHFDARGGYLKPAEGASRLAEAEPMIDRDLEHLLAR